MQNFRFNPGKESACNNFGYKSGIIRVYRRYHCFVPNRSFQVKIKYCFGIHYQSCISSRSDSLMYPMMKTGRMLFYDDHRVVPEISSWFEGDILSMNMILYLMQTLFAGVVIWSFFVLSTGYFIYRILLRLISSTGN